MKTILVIEDDNAIRESITMLLEMEGYQVRTAVNGHDGIHQFRTPPPPDLVLLDLMMPVKNGYEYSVEHRQDPHSGGVPIVVISADQDLDRKQDSIDANTFLKKPIDMNELLNTVAKFV